MVFRKGNIPWNKDLKGVGVPIKTCVCGKKFLSYIGNLGRRRFCSKKCSKQRENNPHWKGDAVSYYGVHAWVKRHLKKPNLCYICKENPPRDLANISQEYKRDLDDWEWLCRKCHMTKDGRIEKLYKGLNKGMKLPRKEYIL